MYVGMCDRAEVRDGAHPDVIDHVAALTIKHVRHDVPVSTSYNEMQWETLLEKFLISHCRDSTKRGGGTVVACSAH